MSSLTRLALLAGVGVCTIPALAIAQEAGPKTENQSPGEEIQEVVVTGTLIKGTAPAGSPVISMTAAEVEAIGATNATELMRRLPQAGDFNSVPQPTTTSSIPYSPVQLRGIGGLSGMATLILLDGKRIVPTATGMNWIDTQMIPAGIIDRVEVITDGGSSTYGSDAVAGVVNFITKREQDGLTLDGTYGFGEGDSSQWDAGITYGGEVGGGTFVLSYAYSDRSDLLGGDLGYLVEDKTASGGQDNRSISCAPGTISANDTTYALPSLAPGSVNYCSAFDELSYYPEEQRHSLFGTLSLPFSENVSLDVNAFWSRREAGVQDPDNARSSGTINSTNPYFSAIDGETSQDVAFSYEDAFGIRKNPSVYKAWQLTPTLNVNFTQNWSARFELNHGESDSNFVEHTIFGAAQAAALAGTTLATALNPYDPAASDPAILAAIADGRNRENSHQELSEARIVLNGSLFDMPAGEAKIAFGAEYRREVYDHLAETGTGSAPTVSGETSLDRAITSVYAELFVPVTEHFRASLSARYDDYDDVGSTTNPKIGLTYEPAEWVSLRGSWGTAFHAPSLADLAAPLGYQLFLPISPFREADSPFFPDFFMPSFLLAGAAPGITPEEATTWSFGADFKPTENLRFAVTYWNLEYTERIDQNAGFFFGPGYYSDPANAPYFILKPETPDEIRNFFGEFPVMGFPDLEAMFAIFGSPYVVSDQRKQNLGALKLDGIDLTLAYSHDAGGGSLYTNLNGTYLLSREKENVRGSGFVETLDFGDFNSPISPLNISGTLGWRRGPFDASTTIYHRSSADVGAETIDSFTTVALFAAYDLTDNIRATLNVDNLFGEEPPLRPSVINGVAYINAGRIIKLGARIKF